MARAVEGACLVLFFAYLLWVPLPFGSIVPAAFPPLVLPPLLIAGVMATIRWRQLTRFVWPVPLLWWATGGALLLLLVAAQLVPLPRSVLAVVSPEASEIWQRSDRVGALAGVKELPSVRPVTIDPERTRREWFRLAALLATMVASAFLIVDKKRRMAFSIVLASGALFQAVYGAREGALERYSIWGWRNTLIFNRVTGTFVNPNHYAHYIAIILPLVLSVGIAAWHRAARPGAPISVRVAGLMDRGIVRFGISMVVAVTGIAAMLLSQSRGALVAAGCGLASLAAFHAADRFRLSETAKVRAVRVIGTAAVVALSFAVIALLVALWLGSERTIARFAELKTNPLAVGGRRAQVSAAIQVWASFPVIGSGAGTFESIVAIAQRENLESVYQHAHNDYVEILATCGLIGFVLTFGALLGGFVHLLRDLIVDAHHWSWTTRSFIACCISSLAVVAVHALYDFNFFMPSNAATAAAIAGAATALLIKETPRRSARGTADPAG